jgi:hypothetical protein
MKIHIIRDSEIKDELYDEVLALLSNSKGILDFVSYNDYTCDITQEVPSHYELFEYCSAFRRKFGSGNRITKDEQVVLLTNKQNDQNWFSSPDFNGNLFIRCSLWNQFDLGCSDEFPIANEVVSTIFHSLLFKDMKDTEAHIHVDESVGCINDFCGNDKRDIRLKMKTADICSDCLSLVKDRDFNIPIFKHITSIIDSLRNSLIAVNRFKSNLGLSRLRFRGDFRLELVDEGVSVKLDRRELIIYLLVLKHREGVNKDEFNLYENELIKLSKIVEPTKPHIDHVSIVQNLCSKQEDIWDNRATIQKKFTDQLGKEISKNYYIWAPRLKPYRIDLDRNLVSTPFSTSLSEYLTF